jgi:hypothetical protein
LEVHKNPRLLEYEMERWYEQAHARIHVEMPTLAVPETLAREAAISAEFAALVKDWKEATWAMGSVKRRIIHPAYLKIIGMGPVAIRLLLKELQSEPDYWFPALEAITRQDPAPEGADMKQLVAAWLAWGERRGYSDSR